MLVLGCEKGGRFSTKRIGKFTLFSLRTHTHIHRWCWLNCPVWSFSAFVCSCVCGGVKFVSIIARIFAICWGQIFQLPYIIRRNPCWLTWETISKWEIGSCKRVSVCVCGFTASQGRDERNVSWEMCPFSPFCECMYEELWGWNFGLRLSSCSSRYLGELETVGSWVLHRHVALLREVLTEKPLASDRHVSGIYFYRPNRDGAAWKRINANRQPYMQNYC